MKFSNTLLYLFIFSFFFPTLGEGKPVNSWHKKKRIAFLVGVNSYSATTSLKYAAKDPEGLEPILAEIGFFDKILTLNDAGLRTTLLDKTNWKGVRTKIDPKFSPDKKTIEGKFEELVAEQPDVLLFYFSGHGFIEGEKGSNTIAPRNIALDKNNKPLNGITLDNLSNKAKSIKQVIFLIDACRNPLPTEKTLANGKLSQKKPVYIPIAKPNFFSIHPEFREDLPTDVLNAEGIIILIGTAENESSVEREDFSGGAFTYFLKMGISGGIGQTKVEEYSTTDSVFEYIDQKLKEDFQEQHPDGLKGKKAKDVYQITTNRGFRGDFLISYGRPKEKDNYFAASIIKEKLEFYPYYDALENRNIQSKLRYFENWNRKELRFFGQDSKTKKYFPESLEGIGRIEYEFVNDKESNSTREFYANQFNLENTELFAYKMSPYNKDEDNLGIEKNEKYFEYKGLYKQTEIDRKDPERKKIQYERKIFNKAGDILLEEYFDSKGRRISINGVSRITKRRIKDNLLIEEYFDQENKPILRNGYAKYEEFKKEGLIYYSKWFDSSGKLVNGEMAVPKIVYEYTKTDFEFDKEYDSAYRISSINYLDANDKLKNNKNNFAKVLYEYDENCMHLKFKKQISSALDRNLALKNWKESGFKACISLEIYLNEKEQQATNTFEIHKKVFKFDKNGNKVLEEFFRENNKRYTIYGIAQKKYEYDELGNILKTSFFGEYGEAGNLVPTNNEDGIHSIHYSYDFNFKDCLKARAKIGVSYEDYECADTITYSDINSKESFTNSGIYKIKIWYHDSLQKERLREFYGRDEIFTDSKENFINVKNSLGVIILQMKLDSKSKPREKIETFYNEKEQYIGKKHFTISGNQEILVSQNKREYAKNDLVSLYADYRYPKGVEVLVEKSIMEYDELGKRTLIENYITRNNAETLSFRTVQKYDNKSREVSYMHFNFYNNKEQLIERRETSYDDKLSLKEVRIYRKPNLIEYLESRVVTDMNGLKISAEAYVYKNNKTELFFSENLFYNEKKQLIRTEGIAKNKKYLTKEIYKDDKLVATEFYIEEKLDRKILYEVDENQTSITKINIVDGVPKYESKKITKYDDRKNIILVVNIEYTPNNEEVPLNSLESKYDSNNNKILQEDYGYTKGKKTLIGKIVSKYNSKNQETYLATYSLNQDGVLGLEKKVINEYDSFGNKILEEYYASEKSKEVLLTRNIFKFNKDKLVRNEFYSNENNELILFGSTDNYYNRNGELIFEYGYTRRDDNFYFIGKKWYDSNFSKLEEKYARKICSLIQKMTSGYTCQNKSIDDEKKVFKEKLSTLKNEVDKAILKDKLEEYEKEYLMAKDYFTLADEVILSSSLNSEFERQNYKLLFNIDSNNFYRIELDKFYRPIGIHFETIN